MLKGNVGGNVGTCCPCQSGSEELQEEQILSWISVLNLRWVVKVWRVLLSLSWWSWKEATGSMSSLEEEWGKG